VVTESLVSVVAGVVIHRTGRYKEIIWLGNALGLLGTGLYITLGTFTSVAKIVIYQIIAGLGTGLLFFPPLLALQNHVSQEDTSAATATFGLIRNLATSISIVVGGVVFQNSMTLQQPTLMAAGLPANLTADLAGVNAAANVFLIGTIQDPMQQLVVKNAFSESLRNIWILYTCVGALGLIASFFITQRSLNNEHTETKTGIRKEGPLPSPVVPLSIELTEIPIARDNVDTGITTLR
jgi:MFS family permease